MYIEISSENVKNMLRSDVSEHLGWEGIDALMEYYQNQEEMNGEKIEYDPALFWSWTKFTVIKEAAKQYGIDYEEISKQVEEDHDPDFWEQMDDSSREEAIDEAIVEELEESHGVILLDSGAILVEE